MKLIVADDSLVMRKIIIKEVESLGYEAVHAANGQQVLELLEKIETDINLVLMDWNMPILNGLETVKAMQENSRYRNIPVLMISTEAEDDKISQAIEAGAKGYLSKPFKAEKLGAEIQKILLKNSETL